MENVGILLFYQLSNQIFFALWIKRERRVRTYRQQRQMVVRLLLIAQRYVLLAYEVNVLTELHYQGVCR